MGLHRVALLIAATVMAGSLSVAAAAPEFEASTPSLRNDFTVTRFLRTGTATEEERGINLKVPGLESLKNRLRLVKWKNTDENLYTVFDILKLGNLGEHLFSSRKFKLWSDFADEIYKKESAAGMFMTLDDLFTNKKDQLALMIQKATETKGTQRLATNLQKEQFDSWADRFMNPDGVITKFFNIRGATIHDDPVVNQIRQKYRSYLDKTHPMWSTW